TTLYAGTSLRGVSKSTDGGMSWSGILADHRVYTLAIDPLMPATLYAGTDRRGTPDGVLKSTDGGMSWSAVNTGLPNNPYVFALAIDPQTPTTLYAATGGGGINSGVFKSSNGGGSGSGISVVCDSGRALRALPLHRQHT